MALPSTASAAVSTDQYEAAPGNNTPATARDVTGAMDADGISGYFGEIMSLQGHTFHFVDDATATSDEDWIKFQVTETNLESAVSYVIEAVATDSIVDPVVELYGPVSSYTQVVPTAPGDLLIDPDDSKLTALDTNARAESNDEGPYFSMLSSSVSFIPPAAGWYYARIRPYYQYEGGPYDAGFHEGVGRYMLRIKTGQLSRMSGATRIDTAVAISQERFAPTGPISGAVVLASAYGFADALSGSTLAGVLGCPVLLTPRDTLPTSVTNEIMRLGAQDVYILGGTSAVSSVVASAVAEIGATPVRIAGATRTETARLVTVEASRLASETTRPLSSVAFLASSRNFPDALSASPMATFNWAPVLLTPGDVLDPQVVAALEDESLAITDVVIVGGTSVISPSVQASVESILGGTSHVRRISGNSRYQTSRNFAIWATGVAGGTDTVGTLANPTALDTLEFARIGIASGRNFPDALAGGVFCGLAGSPILLTDSQSVSPYLLTDEFTTGYNTVLRGDDYWFADDRAIMRSYIFGGKSAVSDYVFSLLDVFTGPAF